MEAYLLDPLLRRETCIDVFESLIWNERFSEYGDFELTMHYSTSAKRMLALGTRVALNESQRIMVLESSENKTDDEGRPVITVSGRSLESVLEERYVMEAFKNHTDDPKWVLEGFPAAIVHDIVDKICRQGKVFVTDIIPFLQAGMLNPLGNIALPNTSIKMEQPLDTVYNVVKNICDIYDMGFRIVRNLDTSKIYFEVYMGNDRTTRQTALMPVIFSPDLDNLTDVTELASMAHYKNVAYVYSKNGTATAYAIGADSATAGFMKRPIWVNASDIELPAGAPLQAALIKRGEDELTAYRSLYAFDGQISERSGYKYNTHYELGDLVEMRTDDGATNIMRVSEQIFISDSSGDKSYPSLTVNSFVMPGTWEAAGALVWDNATGTWAEA